MLQEDLRQLPQTPPELPPTRVGDLAAMLRVMRPLNLPVPDPTTGRRRLLADLCRFIGVQVGSLPPEALGVIAGDSTTIAKTDLPAPLDQPAPRLKPSLPDPKLLNELLNELSPRQEQTLRHLLNGDSEKQVARKLQLSQHTVHVYVKALYRRFGVSSRAELLAKHLKK